MKQNKSIITIIILILLAKAAQGYITVDDFEDNTLNPVLWTMTGTQGSVCSVGPTSYWNETNGELRLGVCATTGAGKTATSTLEKNYNGRNATIIIDSYHITNIAGTSYWNTREHDIRITNGTNDITIINNWDWGADATIVTMNYSIELHDNNTADVYNITNGARIKLTNTDLTSLGNTPKKVKIYISGQKNSGTGYLKFYAKIYEDDYPNNLTIWGTDLWTGETINNYTAIIEGQGQWTTTNGTIIANNLTTNTLYNITINANQGNYDNITYLNYNGTNILQTKQYKETTSTTDYTNQKVGETININCTAKRPNLNQTNFIHNINDTTTTTITGTTYTLLNRDFLDELQITCQLCGTITCTNSTSNATINEQEIDKEINFIGYDYGQLMTDMTWNFYNLSYTSTTNPITLLLTQFLTQGNTTTNTSIGITNNGRSDPEVITLQEINETNTNYTISLTDANITFWFTQNGNPYNTEGYIAQIDATNNYQYGRYGFNGSNITLSQAVLDNSYIHLRVGMTAGTNWTQYYEYKNDPRREINETIELMQTADWSAWIKVITATGTPIEDATIRIQYAYHEIGNWTPHRLLGQRLTDNKGMTFFTADSNTETVITISKDGYVPIQKILTIGDISYTYDEPLTFKLEKNTTNSMNNIYVWTQENKLTGTESNITLFILAKGYQEVEYATNYRRTFFPESAVKYDITNLNDGWDGYLVTLTEGTGQDFKNDENTTIEIWTDDINYLNITIPYEPLTETEQELINIPINLQEKTLNIIILIAMLLIIIITQKTIQGEGIGKTTFYITATIATLISGWFLIITVIGLTELLLRNIHKIISE